MSFYLARLLFLNILGYSPVAVNRIQLTWYLPLILLKDRWLHLTGTQEFLFHFRQPRLIRSSRSMWLFLRNRSCCNIFWFNFPCKNTKLCTPCRLLSTISILASHGPLVNFAEIGCCVLFWLFDFYLWASSASLGWLKVICHRQFLTWRSNGIRDQQI